ncbi:MAG: PKD domain-containing protein [Myxococcota bacterium]
MQRILWPILCLIACSDAGETARVSANFAPFPALRAPVIAPARDSIQGDFPVRLDAGRSFDPDDDPLTYVFEIAGPQTHTFASASPWIDYVFALPGLYTVRVRVIDTHGAQSIAVQEVVAREEFPTFPDFCTQASDCVIGDECSGGICYANDGAVDF